MLTYDPLFLSLNRHYFSYMTILWRKKDRQKRSVRNQLPRHSFSNRHNRLWRYWIVMAFMTIQYRHRRSGQATSDPTCPNWRGKIATKWNRRKLKWAQSISVVYWIKPINSSHLWFFFFYQFFQLHRPSPLTWPFILWALAFSHYILSLFYFIVGPTSQMCQSVIFLQLGPTCQFSSIYFLNQRRSHYGH
jgi:hypothetical protein